MKMFKMVALFAGLCAVLAVPTESKASLLQIDDFNSPAQLVVSGVIPTNNAATLGAIGGWRQLSAVGSFGNLTGTAGVFNGNLVFGNGPAGVGALTVSYTSNNAGLGGGLGTNLGGIGSAFLIDVIADDTIPTVLNLRVEDAFGAVSTSTTNIGGSAAGSTFIVPFNVFIGAADFSIAKFLDMSIVGAANADITLDNFRVDSPVPEPSSLMIALTGLVGAGVSLTVAAKQLAAKREVELELS